MVKDKFHYNFTSTAIMIVISGDTGGFGAIIKCARCPKKCMIMRWYLCFRQIYRIKVKSMVTLVFATLILMNFWLA
ncbi:hypothetical protein [Photorhabdus stackebrandtii]|uniref:hypothetical protein n=1 Tax=Photorhabdus stackebrandtii TaxID=1123042 RepID=UPI00140C8E37|nr:hypothetical protein [Photorhabdus stackebrandtii]